MVSLKVCCNTRVWEQVLKELTDINTLTEEYLRLATHGFRAREKSFNAAITTDLINQSHPLKSFRRISAVYF